MPNMSNKNFPHAQGAGRVIASFSLSHPGGTPGNNENAFLGDATDMLVKPPAFVDSALPAAHPYPASSLLPGAYTWVPDRQPYNATSLGVFVTGSGTRRLPYRDALGLVVPASLSAPLNAAWPANDLYPFSLVDETQLGSTHAQVVCAVWGGDAPGLGRTAYYEVGLNWELPPLRMRTDGGTGITASNFANRAQASFQRAAERTFWTTASLCSDALSEAHPDVDWSPATVYDMNAGNGPLSGMLAMMNDSGDSAYSGPYGALFGNPLYPSIYPVSASLDSNFTQQPGIVQTQVSAIITHVQYQEATPGGPVDVVVRAAPIVRVWVQVPVDPPGEPTDVLPIAPRPLPRQGLNPYQSDDPGLLPPAINVAVLQKNTAAIDGTDGPIYDLFEGWSQLGDPTPPPLKTKAAAAGTIAARMRGEDDR